MPQHGISETVALAPGRDRHMLWKHILMAVDHIGRTQPTNLPDIAQCLVQSVWLK